MTTSSLAMHRRSRRRRQLAIFLTLAVIITVIAFAVSYRTERRETGDYLALVEEIAGDELAASESLRELFDSLGTLDRPDIVQRIDLLTSQAAEAEAALDAAVVTRPIAELHGLFSVAVRSWHAGLTDMDEAVIGVMDQPDDVLELPSEFLAAVDDLRLGDEAYAAFLATLQTIELETEPPDFPEVAFVGGSEPTDMRAIADRLRLRRSFAERHDVEVTANTLPEPTGDRGGVAVMPFASAFDVTAVVTNSGNVLQEEIEVTLQLAENGTGSGEPFEERRVIPALEPQSSLSVEFEAVELKPGTLYTLIITASITDDADLDNNIWEVVFATNSE